MQHFETPLLDSISSPDASPAASSSGKATLPVQSKQWQQNGVPCAKENKAMQKQFLRSTPKLLVSPSKEFGGAFRRNPRFHCVGLLPCFQMD